MAALKADEIDIAIALTEALITGVVKKTADYKIVGTYVTSCGVFSLDLLLCSR